MNDAGRKSLSIQHLLLNLQLFNFVLSSKTLRMYLSRRRISPKAGGMGGRHRWVVVLFFSFLRWEEERRREIEKHTSGVVRPPGVRCLCGGREEEEEELPERKRDLCAQHNLIWESLWHKICQLTPNNICAKDSYDSNNIR